MNSMKAIKPISLALLLGCGISNAVAITTGNLLTNPGAEDGSLNGWTPAGASNPTVDDGTFNPGYGVHSGSYDFRGGTGVSGTLTQNVLLTGNQGVTDSLIDSGTLFATFSFFENSLNQGANSDAAGVSLSFLDASLSPIGSASSGEIASVNPNNWTPFSDTVAIPAGTRTISYQMIFTRHVGNDLDSAVDDNSLVVKSRETSQGVPDAGSTAVLAGLATLGLVAIRRRVA